MKKVLIAYDGSAGGDAALNDLAHAGLPTQLDVTVLSVADVWLPPEGSEVGNLFPHQLPEPVQRGRADAKRALENARTVAERASVRLRKEFPGWNVTSTAVADSPAWAVVKMAGGNQTDLTILGSHGRSMLERFFLGSTAQKVAAEAPCSVRIVRTGSRATGVPLRLLVGVDGSEHAEKTVRWVLARDWPEGTQFRLVTAMDPRLESAIAAPSAFAERWIRPGDQGPEDWGRRILDHALQLFDAAGRQAEASVQRGETKQVLLREAEHWASDCLFLGARGLHHGERLFLGSTASAVTARAHCNVEIVR